ncbi:hypothetical protein CFOL_v3_07804 [Cephalotus follicularis]|uniref:Uncharacterized protein n=1 Tax=Cephalotus follicularis TaxID=3775 RepID=A0A1Q3B8B1_CEPFO|nr:hypothetical protein CFOL_v3_07804 [Cephalotus follicularis]
MRSSAEKRDTEKYCRYHRDHGHDTEECRQLKNQIEDLICKGHLRKYVDRNAPSERRERRGEAPQQPEQQQQQKPRGVIHTISGGSRLVETIKIPGRPMGGNPLLCNNISRAKG